MKFVKRVQVPSQTNPKTKYTVSKDDKGKWSCNCDRWTKTSPRKDCKHITAVRTGKPLPTKEQVMKAKKAAKKANPSILAVKTTRAALINILKKNAGKLVAMKAIHAEVKRVKGWDDPELITKKVKRQQKSVAEWAKQHEFKLVSSSSGMKFQPEA